ncbi:hypothetical protein PHYSODRAFT_323615 [Phytophthora sojae]|uniref:Uncharacterized protein n=1 Tax=Phytophthora sojae (strain P6497) TaxID=1094619 RepID=G4YLC8_PHYSP|nr:hypothetical protein PHYSODRAFT_323615 [Phytophthora sojae]EGZ30196.1 hypothetical protein PHYSODRAFT_323615 [Phytophthora sojae]|eukprot:XP_009517471.1 hypothetical protein PHYSODRAFT_323615 [Phytophthora sojae]
MPRRFSNEVVSERARYEHVSSHASVEEVHIAVHSYDMFQYVVSYNYGNLGVGKVFRCVSHEQCPIRLRMVQVRDEEEEIPVSYRLEVSRVHGTTLAKKKPVGIVLCLKAEVDALLKTGSTTKTCQEILIKKYEGQPEMLAKIPDEEQLSNRRVTLVKNGVVAKTGRWKRARTPSVESEISEERMGRDNEVEEKVQHDDGEADDHFDKTKLMKEFAAFPARPVLWNVLKVRYIDDKNGSMVTQWLTGQVIGWETGEHKPAKWMVRFTDGEKGRLELEELVTMIRMSVRLGLNVTGRPLDI